MPKVSERQKVLKQLDSVIKRRRVEAAFRLVSYDSDDSDTDILVEGIIDNVIELAYNTVLSRCYLLPRKPYRKGLAHNIFQRDLQREDNPDGTPPWLTDDEFVQKYRMNRDSFEAIVELIRDHPAFQTRGKKKQAPVEHQLLLFLFYIGTAGSGANFPRCRQVFGIGRGTCNDYRKRVVAALRSLKDMTVSWPDRVERMAIANRFREQYDFINCIAVADGTLFPLTYEPESDDAPDYHGRKHQYSLTTMIVCDDKRMIRYYLAGFPGCVHDNCVYRNTPLFRSPQDYFGRSFYLLSDSALTNSPTVVASFKCASGQRLTEEEENFNTLLGKPRVISEHTIGMLKGRFQILKLLPMKITNDKKSVKRILRVIDCCVILHNLLIDRGDDDIPDEWFDDEADDYSDVGHVVGEYDMAGHINNDDENDERRRRCIDYFRDMNML